jgi:hypothetical protein
MQTMFGKLVECDLVSKDCVFIVPPIEWRKVIDPDGNLTQEDLFFNPKAAAVIKGIGEGKE